MKPTYEELVSALANMLGAFDTPIARRKDDSEFANEARKIGREVLGRWKTSPVQDSNTLSPKQWIVEAFDLDQLRRIEQNRCSFHEVEELMELYGEYLTNWKDQGVILRLTEHSNFASQMLQDFGNH